MMTSTIMFDAPPVDSNISSPQRNSVLRQDHAIMGHLSQYRFPKGPPASAFPAPCTPPQSPRQGSFQFSPDSPKRRSSIHRRSTPVSLSSTESIFDNTTNLPNGAVCVKKQEFDELANFRKSSEHQMPSSPVSLNSTTTYGQDKYNTATIDLDVASKPLRPRLGSALQEFEHLGFDDMKIDEEPVAEAEAEGSSDGEVSMIDFLRESMSDRAMSISKEYDPTEYINIRAGLWLDRDHNY